MKTRTLILVCSLSLLTIGLGCKKPELLAPDGGFMKIFGTSYYDFPNSIVQTSDGGFMIAGSIGNYSDSLYHADFLFVRTDQYGTPLWYQTFGGEGDDGIDDLVLVSEGEYLALGEYDFEDSSGRSKSVVMRLKETPDSLISIWIKIEDTLGLHASKSALKASDGNFVVAGLVTDGILLTKYSPGGDIVWQRSILPETNARISQLTELSGGGFLLSGNYSDSVSSFAAVWKLDAFGNQVYLYQSDTPYSYGVSVVELPDGKITLLGRNYYSLDSQKVFIQVLRPELTDLNPKMYREFGRNVFSPYGEYLGLPLMLENDGSVVCGWNIMYNQYLKDFILYKIPIVTSDGSIGDMLGYRIYGGADFDEISDVIRTTDGGYALLGYAYYSYDTEDDIVLVRTDSEGRLDPED